MKKTLAIAMSVVLFSTPLFSQHSLTVQGGWTMSNLRKIASAETREASSYYDESFNLSVLHAPEPRLAICLPI